MYASTENKRNLIKKIIFGIIALIIGFTCALYSDSFLRFKIQDIYLLATSNKIEFIGKNFFFFNNDSYYLGFGGVFLILYLANYKNKLSLILKNGFIAVLIFIIFLIITSTIDANLKLVECTACENGIRQLRRNDIKYSLIIVFSLLISIIPSVIQLIRNKKASVQHYI